MRNVVKEIKLWKYNLKNVRGNGEKGSFPGECLVAPVLSCFLNFRFYIGWFFFAALFKKIATGNVSDSQSNYTANTLSTRH